MAQQQQSPITTIPPFTNTKILPACATSCGPLLDANGGCVPPGTSTAAASVYTSCFCGHDQISAFSTTTAGVCDNVCGGAELGSIASWFRDICSVKDDDNNNGGNGNDNDNNNQNSKPTATGDASNNNSGGGGDWISGHWQWVVMLVILVVAIAGIWVGACIWRRRYLKKRERLAAWGRKGASAPGATESQAATGAPIESSPQTDDPRAAGSFMPNSHSAAPEEKRSRRLFGRR